MEMYATQGKTKLNLGSGKDYREDCVNVDVNPKFNPDILADMLDINFPSESFEEVLFQDCLTHVTNVEAKQLLRRIHKWLKPDGLLNIHVPNLDHLVYILRMSQNEELRHEALKWLFASDGKGNTSYSSNVGRWAYNKDALKSMLLYLGFEDFESAFDCSGFGLRVVARKKK